jgi:hypothetical protein
MRTGVDQPPETLGVAFRVSGCGVDTDDATVPALFGTVQMSPGMRPADEDAPATIFGVLNR